MESCESPTSQTATARLLHHLCDACRANFPPHGEWPFITDSSPYYLLRRCTVRDISIAAAFGCHLCTKLLDRLRNFCGGPQTTMETRIKLGLIGHQSRNHLKLCVTFIQSTREKRFPLLHLERLDHLESRSSLDVRSFPSPDSNMCSSSLDRAKEWLSLCRHTHQHCRPGKLMTLGSRRSKSIRLINIRYQDRHNYTCRLVNHFLDVDDVDYMTLSYRWTTHVHKTRLTQKNHTLYYNGIPTNTWPQVYHDAVTVARHLGIQYLWIDALCIIQDDTKDWNEQAALMNFIYERGVLNIAAAMGEKADGLRAYRDSLVVFDCVLSDPSGESWGFLGYNAEAPDLTREAPLYKRGWTFQERVLSTRTLNFGIQLVWECFEGTASETIRLRVPDQDTPFRLKKALRDPASFANFPEMGSTTIQRFSALWQSAVKTFSVMSLTEPSDRMPALQGITNRFGHILNLDPAQYHVAGIWLVDCRQLAWKRVYTKKWLTSMDDDLARELSKHYPSWSWAISTEGVSFFTVDIETQLVEFGANTTHRPRAADPRFITADECISKVVLDSASSSSDMLAYTGITLRGKFIPWLDFRKILRYGQSEHRIEAMCSVPSYSNEERLYKASIWLDRPIPNCKRRSGLRLLPICGRRSYSVVGILVAFCGFNGGLAVYRRLGQFEVLGDYSALERYLHLDFSSTEPGPSPNLRRNFDEWPPFKLI
ncbi:heterokaryon incompatibility protein-domain-containing protein [Pseudoneurospora amorphoporcata]|uniref:Heterokaryon incompatibility protein-domain-containing protein n=1 Tax=Pseudoneurospora amorphoporcata TaxID=241081 RepID=A0AAN6NXU8_9PEZI|nr:heterokaryon incompatibility protein-domain-containing protein [Pseudoneurospora amorphoporcata]